ncbi:tubulin-specific chaperone cofactor E-like protein [Alicycliphilus sp. B1]|nr:tubulin-specific chaperone cofactor E-like protein [Alicycliphilus sp. B1]
MGEDIQMLLRRWRGYEQNNNVSDWMAVCRIGHHWHNWSHVKNPNIVEADYACMRNSYAITQSG